MALFTIIVGSAYPEASDEIAYIVDAISPEYAMIQAEKVCAGHNSGPVTTYFCMEGVTTFYRKSPSHDPVKVVDLRPLDPETIGCALNPAEEAKVITALKDTPGAMLVPGHGHGYVYFVRPPGWDRDQMQAAVWDAVGRKNFTINWTTLSVAQSRISEAGVA